MINNNELYHYGILGMKWGKRKANNDANASRLQRAKATYKSGRKNLDKKYDADYAAMDRDTKHFTVNNKKVYDDFNKATDKYLADRKAMKDAYKAEKKAIKSDIKAKTAELNKKASFAEKLVYNKNTRKKAAKYIVNNNMTVEAATKKAKGDAWRNTAALIAAYGAVSVATLYKLNH